MSLDWGTGTISKQVRTNQTHFRVANKTLSSNTISISRVKSYPRASNKAVIVVLYRRVRATFLERARTQRVGNRFRVYNNRTNLAEEE